MGAASVAKLTDFGGASLVGEEGLTRTGDVLGTLAYMAPEQIEGHEVDGQADLYSLALVLYEALSGVNPVRGPTPAATARRIGQKLESLERHRRDLPHGLTRALDRALDPEPQERGTLFELRDALSAALERNPVRVSTEHPHEEAEASGWLTLPRLGWLAGTLAVCAWQLTTGRSGVALIVLCAVAPLVLLVRRPAARWLALALAPALGLAGLAGAFPALAGQAARWRSRALLGALGYWWLCLAEPCLTGTRSLPCWAWRRLLGAAVWATAAAILPWVVRGRSAMLDAFAAILWATALAASGGVGVRWVGTAIRRRPLPCPRRARRATVWGACPIRDPRGGPRGRARRRGACTTRSCLRSD